MKAKVGAAKMLLGWALAWAACVQPFAKNNEVAAGRQDYQPHN